MSDIWIKTSNTATTKWRKALSIKIKRFSSTWVAAKVIWIKNTSQGWLRVWPTSGVFPITDPYITTTSSGSTPLYGNLTVGTNDVIRIGTTYYGRNGTWDPNGFTISSYSYSWPYYSSSDSSVSYDEIGSLASGVYSSPSQALSISNSTDATATDGKYISFRITANASNALYSNTADSRDSYGKIKVIRRTPINISFSINGSATVGSTLSIGSGWNITEAYKPDAIRTTIKWYRSDSATAIYSGGGRTEITSASGSYQYIVDQADSGKYIVAEETTFNTGSDYDIGVDQFINGQNQVTAVSAQIGSALVFTNVLVKDYYGQKGLDNRDRWPTGTLNQYTGQLSGYDSNTTIRIRYRVYNFDTGLYWKPSTGTQTTASAAWDSWNSDGSGNGYISDVSVSGSIATFYDYFDLSSSSFNGGGSGPTWWLEVELSALRSGGTRVYYINPYETFYISKRIDPTVIALPATVQTNANVTISGGFNGFPATPSTNAYPRQYIVYYGDGTNSGYLPVGEFSNGTVNPAYSVTKSYSTTGTKNIEVRSVPYGESATTSVSVQNFLTAPTISSVTPGIQSGPVSVSFSGGSGPNYQMYWSGSSSAPTSAVTPDASGSSSPLTDTTGPSSTSTNYMYVRSVATTGETSVGPSNVASAWSAGVTFNMTSGAVTQNTAPNARATSTNSTTIVKYLDSITWTAGTYNNASSINSVLLYSTNTANLQSPGGNTNSLFRSTSPYTIQTSDPAGTPYVFAVRDTVVGINGTTYYFYGNQITSANADAVAFSYGTATSSVGGWTASINSGAQTGATYSYVSATAGSGTVSSSTGAITASGLTSAQSSTITVNKAVSGYDTASTTATGTASTVVTYTLTYSANGGSTTPSPQSGSQGSSITLASGAGTRSGFTFGGWNIGGTTYAGSASYTFGAANATATAIWNAVFVPPTSPAPSWSSGSNFQRVAGSSILRWFTDYPSISGSGSITGMNFEIRTTAGGGTLLASGTRSYPGDFTYPYSAAGTVWAFRCGTSDGDISYSSSARFARARVVMLGTNGTTYFGTWSGWI